MYDPEVEEVLAEYGEVDIAAVLVEATLKHTKNTEARRLRKKEVDRIRNQRPEYQSADHKERKLQYGRKWRRENPDKQREINKEYRLNNEDKCKAYNKRWAEENSERVRKAKSDWYQANKERALVMSRAAALKRKYGLTSEQWDQMFESQGYKCKICPSTDASGRGWHTDHCHTTGKVRGILCNHCNLMLGYVKDNTETLASAIRYLEASRGV